MKFIVTFIVTFIVIICTVFDSSCSKWLFIDHRNNILQQKQTLHRQRDREGTTAL